MDKTKGYSRTISILIERYKGDNNINIIHLYNFIGTANQNSFSKASERVNISQPALSKQIRKNGNAYSLEEALG